MTDSLTSTQPDTDVVRLYMEDWGGDGPTVLLIHGWPLSGASWEHQVRPLHDAGFRVITYDRRGFGQSDRPDYGFDYDTLAADLRRLIVEKDLRDITLVGFSMGGGEVARYVANHGEDRIRAVVFAAAVPPYLMRMPDNPEGPLTEAAAENMEAGLTADREAFFDDFTRKFFTANGRLDVPEEERQRAIALCRLSDQKAALGCMEAFGTTDFREDLRRITVPTLVIHGDADAIVPLEGSGARTHAAVPGSRLVVLEGAPHGCNASHPLEFNAALIRFLNETRPS